MIKKQLIMEKALELFAEQGFEATSVQQITERCGISKGAFYLSFKSKDELISALIDHFMMQFVSDIDYIVKKEGPTESLLYEFYYSTFDTFHKRSNFAKILIKEQMQSLNEELFLKMRDYDNKMEKSIQTMIERLYGEEIDDIKYDLILTIKALLNTYSQLFILFNIPSPDMELLCRSLVEKTNLLALNVSVPFITKDLYETLLRPLNEEISRDQLIELLHEKSVEIEEPVEKESLSLLAKNLEEPLYSTTIVKGLIENIRNHPHCKWVSYLLRQYYKI
ncbi:transcriptional regulator [Bacillus sp. FJAT-27225]|uniref:TetR/AcrR family transcriptional regulator n=1 Tax=Bacillus sp. FJAT-27225 TaxID=1743144 RepID=UPI00080C3026|nr:TetR/AcrR family transcriptional regulator [Bacillus sp. FJAT-27225]OCA82256.1 transcriptional regulator [Bacillus sp. FJAT-27225]